jgi:hypothetical protein
MGRRLSIKPLETLTLEFGDRDIDFAMNNYALIVLREEFGDIGKLVKEFEQKPYELGAILLYCGAKTNNTDFTLDDARVIIASGGNLIFDNIMEITTDSLVVIGGPEVEKKYLLEMQKQMKK